MQPRGTRQKAQEKQTFIKEKVNKSLSPVHEMPVSFSEKTSHSDRAGTYQYVLWFAVLSFSYFRICS